MKCELCGEREAVIIFTQIVKDKKTVMHLCGECAARKGITHLKGYSSPPKGELERGLSAGDRGFEKLRCPSCGLSYSEFRKGKLLGCGECYTAFYPKLRELLRDVHGVDRHLRPGTGERAEGIRRAITSLKESLKLAIEREAFEEAARIRDRIAKLERRR